MQVFKKCSEYVVHGEHHKIPSNIDTAVCTYRTGKANEKIRVHKDSISFLPPLAAQAWEWPV